MGQLNQNPKSRGRETFSGSGAANHFVQALLESLRTCIFRNRIQRIKYILRAPTRMDPQERKPKEPRGKKKNNILEVLGLTLRKEHQKQPRKNKKHKNLKKNKFEDSWHKCCKYAKTGQILLFLVILFFVFSYIGFFEFLFLRVNLTHLL